MSALVSILNPASRKKDGKALSFEVVGEAPLTPELVVGEGWSPVLYSKPRRAQVNFLEARVVGFDVDDRMSLAEAVSKFAGYRHIIGTTTNHQLPKGDKPPCDRFRLILFLEEPVFAPEDYKATLSQRAIELGIPVDPQAKDAARWFVPCREVISARLDDGLLVAPVAAEVPTPQPLPTVLLSADARGKLSRATRDFLAQEPSPIGEDWHLRFIKAGMDFKEQSYSIEEAALRLRSASPTGELDATDLTQLADIYANRGGALPFRPAWPEQTPATDRSPARPVPASVANQRYLLTEVLGYSFAANTRREVVYYSTRDSDERRLLTDTLLATLNTGARTHGIAAGESLRDLIITIAQENAFDPILEPLNSLAWDGGAHIRSLFSTLHLPEGTTDEARKWYELFLRRWLIGVVTKVYRPGSENNVLVFQGEQAAGKSRWLKRLSELWPDGWGEGSISPDDKDHELRHLDNFIWHVAEFDSTTSRREVGALKDYFTKDTVNVRRPYARLPIVGRSICSFCASVNSHEFLHDSTGNRRYLVIPITGLNADHAVSIPQVFAEAKAAMEAGERQWFNRDEIAEINKLNAHFLSKEEYLEAIEARCEPGEDALTIASIMDKLGYFNIQLTRPIRSNIRTILEKKKIKKQVDGSVTRFKIAASLLEPLEPSKKIEPKSV